MMAKNQAFASLQVLGEDCVASVSCGGLQAEAAIKRYLGDMYIAVKSKRCTEGTAVSCPAGALRMQAMIHMHGAQAASVGFGQAGKCMQQRGGIGTATVGDAERPLGVRM